MKLPKIQWIDQQLFKKTPLLLVIGVTIFVGFNVYLKLLIKNTSQDVSQITKSFDKPPRNVKSEFSKKIDLGETNCPYQKAGNPDAPVRFKVFESETCPFCIAQNKVLDELLPEYGDLFYGEWYGVNACAKDAEKYQISGVPTFIFSAKGVEKPPAYGFLDKQQLVDYFCSVSQQC